MNKFEKLVEGINRAKELLEERERRLDEAVYPILKAIGVDRVHVKSVSFSGNKAHIEYGWSSRGNSYEHTKTLPRAIFDAKNPVEAASEFMAQITKDQAVYERKSKMAQLKKLQAELNVSI